MQLRLKGIVSICKRGGITLNIIICVLGIKCAILDDNVTRKAGSTASVGESDRSTGIFKLTYKDASINYDILRALRRYAARNEAAMLNIEPFEQG